MAKQNKKVKEVKHLRIKNRGNTVDVSAMIDGKRMSVAYEKNYFAKLIFYDELEAEGYTVD
jgi:hypothetical protein